MNWICMINQTILFSFNLVKKYEILWVKWTTNSYLVLFFVYISLKIQIQELSLWWCQKHYLKYKVSLDKISSKICTVLGFFLYLKCKKQILVFILNMLRTPPPSNLSSSPKEYHSFLFISARKGYSEIIALFGWSKSRETIKKDT